jgi:hypothetical protein
MSVTFELIDAPYPYLCAVYRCPCGDVEVRSGNEAAIPPDRWELPPGGDGDDSYICPRCAARARAAGDHPG